MLRPWRQREPEAQGLSVQFSPSWARRMQVPDLPGTQGGSTMHERLREGLHCAPPGSEGMHRSPWFKTVGGEGREPRGRQEPAFPGITGRSMMQVRLRVGLHCGYRGPRLGLHDSFRPA